MTTRMFRSPTLLPLALALFAGSVAAACSSAGGSAGLAVSCDEFGTSAAIAQAAEIKVGGEITIALCSNPTTGFSWEVPAIADPAVVSVVASGVREPQATPPIVGAPGTQFFTLKGLAAGTTKVTLAYSQPWDGGQKGAWRYEVAITVK